MKRRGTQAFCVMMAFILFLMATEPVLATTISDLQNDIRNQQSQLNSVNQQIAGYQDAQEGVEEEISDLDAEMVALLTDINLIQEAIKDKEEDIANTQIVYDEAVSEKDKQYESMKVRIKFMYEKGDESYLQLFLGARNMSDMMNKAHYIEELYEYDRNLLEQYEAIVQQVAELQDRLEEEKSELVTSRSELEEEQAYVNEVLEEKKKEYENYNTILAKAKREAAAYTAKIKQETAQIRKLEEEERKRREEEERRRREEEERKRKEEEERRKAAEEAANAQQGNTENTDNAESMGGADNSNNSDTSATTDNYGNADNSGESDNTPAQPAPSGGGKGQEIANFACKYIGYPYVAGGTSLTNGADCSGFVLAVYKNFGYSLPRSSYAQAGAGRAVSYSEAQPGDIIYYGGHVGIYIGNGQIVHASTERSGIKITSATYRSIITVRRIV